jgi:hypothetical protein
VFGVRVLVGVFVGVFVGVGNAFNVKLLMFYYEYLPFVMFKIKNYKVQYI